MVNIECQRLLGSWLDYKKRKQYLVSNQTVELKNIYVYSSKYVQIYGLLGEDVYVEKT